MKKIIVGMSGGVDSTVTAYLLKNEGYEVVGLSLILYEARMKNIYTGCCSIEAINDAKRSAEQLGIKHMTVDLRDEFLEKVIEPFIEQYHKGITPNPCILCNRYIKFPHLLKIADEKDADFIATGHYARVEKIHEPEKNGFLLKKGIDQKKDQSYVLYVLRQQELSRLRLPLGEKTKDMVRQIAKELNLPAAKRPESQEICFIEDRQYFRFIDFGKNRKGEIIDLETGKKLGYHNGIYLYTIGQRKRLGIATGKPLYVIKIDPLNNTIFVGPREAALKKSFTVKDVNWLVQKTNNFRATVKIRSTMKDEPANIILINKECAEITYDQSQWAPAPGQSAVFYDGDIVIGGGIIT